MATPQPANPTYSPPTPSPAPAWRPTPVPIPTVADAQVWALAELGPAEYAALDHIVTYESHWDPAAVNKRSGACGLGQFWPCSKMSDTLPDWATRPLEQLRDYVIPYGLHKFGSLRAAWAYECAHGIW